ncbi:class I SAM-dependent methyltransferase [Candidatus Saccharibacteria bacterium]|nr:class I SAM-dependent methyltransferase [Candidatus Saccharibacteria bacterium]
MNRLTKALWSLYAKSYDGLLYFWPYKNLLGLMAARSHPAAGEVMLDLGCGTGNLLKILIEASPNAHFIGLDVSSGMLEVARRKLAVQIKTGTVELTEGEIMTYLRQQPNASFDVIASMNVLYTIADQTGLWYELMRVLRPGGRIIITASVRPGSGAIIAEHFAHATLWPLLRLRLLAVFIIDAIINVLGHTGHFAFSDEATLEVAVEAAGGHMHDAVTCYGGSEKGVNTLFTVSS